MCCEIGASAVELLIPAIKDNAESVRRAVAEVLGELKDARETAASAIENKLGEWDPGEEKREAWNERRSSLQPTPSESAGIHTHRPVNVVRSALICHPDPSKA